MKAIEKVVMKVYANFRLSGSDGFGPNRPNRAVELRIAGPGLLRRQIAFLAA